MATKKTTTKAKKKIPVKVRDFTYHTFLGFEHGDSVQCIAASVSSVEPGTRTVHGDITIGDGSHMAQLWFRPPYDSDGEDDGLDDDVCRIMEFKDAVDAFVESYMEARNALMELRRNEK